MSNISFVLQKNVIMFFFITVLSKLRDQLYHVAVLTPLMFFITHASRAYSVKLMSMVKMCWVRISAQIAP